MAKILTEYCDSRSVSFAIRLPNPCRWRYDRTRPRQDQISAWGTWGRRSGEQIRAQEWGRDAMLLAVTGRGAGGGRG
ncbi:MAG: hypothetical protein ACRET5_17530, partial [Steroidobacteraceae bacterium]